jgi:hypothetical protein
MNRKHFGLGQAYHLMHWLSEVHPEVFKEWVAIQDVMNKVNEPDGMIVDEMESEG